MNPGDGDGLKDTHEEHEVDVQVVVNNIEEGEAPVEAEDGRAEGSDNAKNKGNNELGELFADEAVLDNTHGGLNHSESRVDTEGEQGNSEEQAPEIGCGHGLNGSRVGNEGEADRGDLGLDGGVHTVEVTNGGEHSEASEERETGVTEGNGETIGDDGCVSGVVGRVGDHHTNADGESEEDLGAGFGPHGSGLKLLGDIGSDFSCGSCEVTLGVPVDLLAITIIILDAFGNRKCVVLSIVHLLSAVALKVHTEAFIRVFEGETVHDHDENEENGEGHGNPDNLGGELNTLEDADEADNPNEDLGEENFGLEFGGTTHGGLGVVGLAAFRWIGVNNVGFEDINVEVSLGDGHIALAEHLRTGATVYPLGINVLVNSVRMAPGEGACKGAEEKHNGPGNDHIVVNANQVASGAGGETDTVHARVELVPDFDVTSLENLTKGELKHNHRNTQEEQAEEVGDEEKGSTVLEAQVREPPQVTQTNG